jgi:selenide,water dikinase
VPAASRHLILAGGGHAHLEVLRRLARRPVPGARLTLVSREPRSPYSGLLPGCVAGRCAPAELLVDLAPPARRAGADFRVAEVAGLDPARRTLRLADGTALRWDVLSLNTGAAPAAQGVPGVPEHVLPVKPIGRFLPQWEALHRRVAERPDGPWRLAVAGAGAAGVELAFAVHARLTRDFGPVAAVTVIGAGAELLPGHAAGLRAAVCRRLAARGIRVITGVRVAAVSPGRVTLADGGTLDADAVLWATHAAPPAWLAATGLARSAGGFLAVRDTLESASHPGVFAAGDVADVGPHPRPKAGVFAVRQGPPLAENLRRALAGAPPRPFTPQRDFLTILGAGPDDAVAARGRWVVGGRWVARWKERIDRRWLRRHAA